MATVRVGDEEWEFDFANPWSKDLEAIETVAGKTFKQWREDLQEQSIHAMADLVFVLQRKTDPHVRRQDVNFRIGDFAIVDDAAASQEAGDAVPLDEAIPGPGIPAESSPTSDGST